MSFTQKQKEHVHAFNIEVNTKVLPHKHSRMNFRDTLKQRKCKCGAVETYDLERTNL